MCYFAVDVLHPLECFVRVRPHSAVLLPHAVSAVIKPITSVLSPFSFDVPVCFDYLDISLSP